MINKSRGNRRNDTALCHLQMRVPLYCKQYATLGKSEAYFQSPKILGDHNDMVETIVAEKLYAGSTVCLYCAGSSGQPAEHFALLDKISIFEYHL